MGLPKLKRITTREHTLSHHYHQDNAIVVLFAQESKIIFRGNAILIEYDTLYLSIEINNLI